jgi:hypothetical protein
MGVEKKGEKKPSAAGTVPEQPTRKIARKPAPPVTAIDERFLPTYDEDDGGNPAIDLLATKIPDPPTFSR